MKVDIRLILITQNHTVNAPTVLLTGYNLPGKNLANNPPNEVVKQIAGGFIEGGLDHVSFELCGQTHDRDKNKLTLYFYTFLPWPVPTKKGNWHIVWDVFRETENNEVFNILQECSIKTIKRIQTTASRT